MTEKQKKIADLKQQLLAEPANKKKPAAQPIVGGGGKVQVQAPDDMQDKFKRVMDWGTPRLVTKTRHINMDASKQESRSLLMKFANVRKGVVDESLVG